MRTATIETRRYEMKTKVLGSLAGMVLAVAVFGLITTHVSALEIITEEDFKQKTVTVDHLVKTADNAVFLFDTSGSMRNPLEGTEMTRLEALRGVLTERMGWFPDLGYNFGLYLFTPWKELHPVQPFNREELLAAIDQLPKAAGGGTPLQQALHNLDPILAGLSGRTAVFLFSDGKFNHDRQFKWPWDQAQALAEKNNVCFYILSTAEEKKAEKTLQRIADVNECSRVIPFITYVKRPGYTSSALFVVDSQKEIVTVTEEKVVGVKGKDILFGFDNESVPDEYKEQLDRVGKFVNANPGSYVVVNGYADNTGAAEYNMKLSHRRAGSVADYLKNNHSIDDSRMVIMWYGDLNPTASNDTEEGRKLNRRAEIAVGLE
jgi:OOP family OmpA-OmpF porin